MASNVAQSFRLIQSIILYSTKLYIFKIDSILLSILLYPIVNYFIYSIIFTILFFV